MANTKISDLPGTTTLTDEDAMPVVQEGVTKKFTGVLTALKTLLGIGNPETLQTQSKEVVGAVNELNGKCEEIEESVAASAAVVRNFGDIGHRDAGATIYANIVMQKISPEKCNVHISASMTALTNTSNDIFNIFDIDKIETLLGISSLNFSTVNTRAVIQTVTGDSISPSSIGYGLCFSGSGIGRFYSAEGAYGVWPSNKSTVYHAGNFYYIDIFGASYTPIP